MAPRELRPIAESQLELSEIVGEESMAGQPLHAGRILALMDMVAGRVSAWHARSAVATLSFDRVDLTHAILHQDLVRLEGRLISVGRSSMVVDVRGTSQSWLSREFKPVLHSFITMVAVDGQGVPDKNIPGLKFQTPQEERIQAEVERRRRMTAQWLAEQEALDGRGDFTVEEVEEPDLNRAKQNFVPPSQTEVTVRRQFLPRHININGTIFGGEILLWMDKVATHTARGFTRNRNMVTIAMNRIFFKQPIYTTDLVEMTARVVYVRRYTLEVEINVKLRRISGEELSSHSGFFTVLNTSPRGEKMAIQTGLLLTEEDQDSLRRYQKARLRHEFWASHRESFFP
ncbi:MAG: acyl-CoA thioesterase [Deltaproteobacteria bacterium]|nr:acyl-CoA thioesterase [Deltaproteobacteria bacterium]